jgi:long-chain acyl-CoA synthetase
MTKLDSRVRKNVLLLMEKKTGIFENRVAVGIKRNNGWQELTFSELGKLSRKLACYLMDLQLKRGDKIAILSDSRPEWGVCVFASVLAGTITIPLDIKLTIYELKPILEDCAPKILLVSKKFLDTAKKLQEEIPSIEKIILMEEDDENPEIPNIYKVEPTKEHGFKHRNPSATALIIYT